MWKMSSGTTSRTIYRERSVLRYIFVYPFGLLLKPKKQLNLRHYAVVKDIQGMNKNILN